MRIGWRRTRLVLCPVLLTGIVGTLFTAVALAALGHAVLRIGWYAAFLLGVAIAPTDPAVVFSVLGRQEISGRAATILEGESGAH